MTQPHRGLPPPVAMTLPSTSQTSSIGPIPPHIWQSSSEETVRSLLQIRTEEERHASEQQRTKQEELRLETRRTELSMLREALQSGMPSPLVALMFAGTGNLRGVGTEIIQGYIADLQHQHLAGPGPGTSWDHQSGFSTYGARGSSSRSSQSGPSQPGAPPPQGPQPHRASLPRINMSEMQAPKSGQLPTPNPVLHPSPMPHPTPQAPAPAPEVPPATQSQGIYFHHWQPPNSQAGGQTPVQRASSPQRQLGSPFTHLPPSHLSGSEVSSSPKRRKTTSGQPYSPPYQITTASGVTPARRRAHSRQRSESASTSVRPFDPYHRPTITTTTSRPRRSEGQGDEHSGGPSSGHIRLVQTGLETCHILGLLVVKGANFLKVEMDVTEAVTAEE
ncbi:hypothetical protein BDZ91DRAFT_767763 [Kalaharituber pfeilii]|nr:hypothetical protein BDZ91DRAFT_767763 [Kalaharituber pfeilii]